ncbi:type II toxin-antitoxin system VapC family toxin [Rhizobium sp. BR 362]|uniref:type II toxin-antitoxin system VapC family toxin n=1 Tax=Rhizobium sp. BR 362 TaxID=3040670 RepID=UPI002F3F67AA
MAFDLRAALRSIKPEKRAGGLRRRDDHLLTWAENEPSVGGPVLLDTSVYLDVLQGKSTEAVDRLLTYRLCYHSAVCLSELTHVFGRLDAAHPATKSVLKTVSETISDIPSHRLDAPDIQIWGSAGILAGLLARLSNMPRNAGHERRFLNDALVLLQAQDLGISVLTGNIRDFDYLTQILPRAKVICYRTALSAET